MAELRVSSAPGHPHCAAPPPPAQPRRARPASCALALKPYPTQQLAMIAFALLVVMAASLVHAAPLPGAPRLAPPFCLRGGELTPGPRQAAAQDSQRPSRSTRRPVRRSPRLRTRSCASALSSSLPPLALRGRCVHAVSLPLVVCRLTSLIAPARRHDGDALHQGPAHQGQYVEPIPSVQQVRAELTYSPCPSPAADGKDVILNDGVKLDSTGRESYFVSYCYTSSNVKGSTSESASCLPVRLGLLLVRPTDELLPQARRATARQRPTRSPTLSTVSTSSRARASAAAAGSSRASSAAEEAERERRAGSCARGSSSAVASVRPRALSTRLQEPADVVPVRAGGLGGSSFGGSPLGGSPLGGSPFDSPLSSSPLDVLDGGSPADNFDATKAVQGVGSGSSDALAGQSGLLGDERGNGPSFGNLDAGRGGGDSQGASPSAQLFTSLVDCP